MEPAYWLDVWEQPTQGFDQGCVNRSLELYVDRLGVQPGATVFVPLCGRAYDMKWLLEKGFHVIGVELSEKAIISFFETHEIVYETRDEGPFTCYEGEQIRIYLGDFFELNETHLRAVDAVYDRASLVAMPPQMREDYVAHMRTLFSDGVNYLLVSLEFDVEEGPPFSLSDAVIQKLYNQASRLEKLGGKDLIELEPRFKEKGCSYFMEKAHLIQL